MPLRLVALAQGGALRLAALAGVTLGAFLPAQPAPLRAQDAPAATFRSGVDVVRLAAVVRDKKGRFVQNLQAKDFEILDSGQPRPIAEFRRDSGAIMVALLFDASGSMKARAADARETAMQLLSALDPAEDEAAIFAFDTALRQLSPFTVGLRALPEVLDDMTPFGATALHDAIHGTASRLAHREGLHRAVVVLTDGLDNASRMPPDDVYAFASAIDAPVYIVGLMTTADAQRDVAKAAPRVGTLADLAARTGGHAFVATTPGERNAVARRIVDDLRHQYLMAFESRADSGWHPLVIRARGKGLTVRARSGYSVGPPRRRRNAQ
jgi:Ca-activated chloride channel family protein